MLILKLDLTISLIINLFFNIVLVIYILNKDNNVVCFVNNYLSI